MRTRKLVLLGLLAVAGCGSQSTGAAAAPSVTGLRYIGSIGNVFVYVDDSRGIRCYAYFGSGISCVTHP